MFLSRVEIPWPLARNAYDVHRHLWKLFPDQPSEPRQGLETPRQGFLYRIEEKRPGQPMRLLLQSRMEPVHAAALVIHGCREIHPDPQPGQTLAFLLTANPIKTIADAEKAAKPGKVADKCRVPLIHEDEQLAWLSRKLADAASVETASAQPHEPLHFRKGNRPGKLAAVTFEGVLRVHDPDALLRHLENGLGPAKAFGCGLLLVRRI